MNDNYWLNRIAKVQNAISEKTIAEVENQLKKYYKSAMKKVIKEFESVYDKILNTVEDGREITPADLYKLDTYWSMQGQLKREMQKLGDKEIELLSKAFEKEYYHIYLAALPGIQPSKHFNTIAAETAKQVVNHVWLNDGKNFSQRVWKNTERLTETLNDELIHCIAVGKKTSELKLLLQDRFNVSYNNADMLVKTEVTHIQTQAAKQRYEDAGLTHYIFYADPDERTCGDCEHLHNKKFLYAEMKPGVNAPPMHPRDRCCIVPVVED